MHACVVRGRSQTAVHAPVDRSDLIQRPDLRAKAAVYAEHAAINDSS
jgi:hypothetical protein